MTRITIADGHVHIYDCFSLPRLLEAARANFAAQGRIQGAVRYTGVLLLAEASRDHWFQKLATSDEGHQRHGRWAITPVAGDPCALSARRDTGETLILIAGRQIVTQEGLEVLALLTDRLFSDGQHLEAAVQTVFDGGAVPVVPWAFGKWIGRRGRVVGQLLTSCPASSFCLGDNGGRPGFWRNVDLFRRAAKAGVKIVPGSDPLPLPSEEGRVGSYGFILEQEIANSHPSRQLKELLLDPSVTISAYGKLARTFAFIRNQLRIRCVHDK